MERIQTIRRRHQALSTIPELEYTASYWEKDYQTNNSSTGTSISLCKEIIKTNPESKVKFTCSGIPFYEILPAGSVRCKVYTQFYRLKSKAKTWKEENIELRMGMYFLIFSPTANKFFLRQVHEGFNPKELRDYIRDKNLYLINP